jgi:hypothetical protein
MPGWQVGAGVGRAAGRFGRVVGWLARKLGTRAGRGAAKRRQR